MNRLTTEGRWRRDADACVECGICLACGSECDEDGLSEDGLCSECLMREARPSWLSEDSDWEGEP